jgi:hypothetical protein
MAEDEDKVDEFYKAAILAGARDNISPRARLAYYPGYYAADVFDLDGYRRRHGGWNTCSLRRPISGGLTMLRGVLESRMKFLIVTCSCSQDICGHLNLVS